MKLETLKNKLAQYKAGTFVKIKWTKDIASAKAKKAGISIVKECEGLVRVGVSYSRVSAAQAAIAKRAENPAPVKPIWYKHVGGGIVEHKEDSSKKYLQVFTVPGHKIKSKVKVQVSLEELYKEGYINKSELPKQDEEPVVMFTLGLDNITQFGND